MSQTKGAVSVWDQGNVCVSECELADLARCVWFLVAGQDLEHNAAAGLLKHVLQYFRVAPHLLPVDLFDDITNMQKALLINHTTMQDACNHQLAALHTERHTLGIKHMHRLSKLKSAMGNR